MAEARGNDGMKYIGDGTCLPGVPARDLTAEEVREYGGPLFLLSTGLYVEIKKAYTPKPAKSAFKTETEEG